MLPLLVKPRRICRTLAAVPALAALLACGDGDSGGQNTPPGADIGSACTQDQDCKSGWCFSDPTFPGAYCSLKCDNGSGATCPEGSTCHAYQGTHQFCMADCQADTDCRADYVCDYNVCRPKCTDGKTCQGTDTCVSGRCKGPCKKDDDCPSGTRCQDGKCVPPCTRDSDCLPGYTCDTGAGGGCKAKPGKKMGEGCGKDSECATGYCLPTTRRCSVTCTGSAACPSGWVCGLERLDKDVNGTPDGAATACVPVKGSTQMGAACAKDADCRSNHCYNGLCMEGCGKDADCDAAHRCVTVNLLLGGGIPQYKGCLPRQGTSVMTLGSFSTNGSIKGFDVPPGASSFVLSTRVASQSEIPAVLQLKDPKGLVVSEVKGQCASFSVTNRYNPDREISSLFVPISPEVTVTPGVWMYTLTGSSGAQNAEVKLHLKLGLAQKGTLNLNWVFLNLAGTCIPGATLNAAAAPNHAWLTKLRTNLKSILTKMGLSIGKETFADLKDPTLDDVDVSSTSDDLAKLFATSKGISGSSINVYFVRKIDASTMGGVVLGIAGGIPGPVAEHGTVHSGVAMSMQTACYEKYGYNPAHTLAHEFGHYLGLAHNVEQPSYPGLDRDQSKVVCPCPCGQHLTCYKEPGFFGQQWCRGLDSIADTDQASDNLMYYAAENTNNFTGNKISAGQKRVVLNNPLVGH